jgi:hypothetical protein
MRPMFLHEIMHVNTRICPHCHAFLFYTSFEYDAIMKFNSKRRIPVLMYSKYNTQCLRFRNSDFLITNPENEPELISV